MANLASHKQFLFHLTFVHLYFLVVKSLINESHFDQCQHGKPVAMMVVTLWYRNQLTFAWLEGPAHLPNNHIEY